MNSNLTNHLEPKAGNGPPESQHHSVQTLFAKLIQEINQRMVSGSDFEQTFDFIFDALSLLIPYDRLGIALLNKDSDQVEFHWVRSKIPIQYIRKGYTVELGDSSLKHILESGQPRIINDLIEYARSHPGSRNTQLIIKDGIRSNLTCPLRANGKPVGFVFFSSSRPGTYGRDHQDIFLSVADELSVIVEQSRLHRRFESALSKEQFIRMMLHDLKSPLSVIQGVLEEFASFEWFQNLSPEGREIFGLLHRNAHFMLGLLDELSDLMQVEGPSSSVKLEIVDLMSFLREVQKNAEQLASRKDIQFTLELSEDLPLRFRFDPNLIRRALENLITNAIKFSHRHKQIKLKVWLQDQQLFFLIQDQGLGIPEAEISKLFHEFGKTSVRPTEGEHSSGIGLAITKRIIDNHGGKITVESTPGKGSTFTFFLPDRNGLDSDASIHRT